MSTVIYVSRGRRFRGGVTDVCYRDLAGLHEVDGGAIPGHYHVAPLGSRSCFFRLCYVASMRASILWRQQIASNNAWIF